MFVLAQLALGWLYGHWVEYCAHRWIFHNRKYFPKAFKFHYAQHHARSKRGVMVDVTSLDKHKLFDHEIQSLFWGCVIHSPIAFWFPYFYVSVVLSALAYYFMHRRSHQDFKWGRTWIPWHYDHHMGPNSNMNWGVRSDIFDRLLRTRDIYKGTTKELIRYRNFEYRGSYALRPRRLKRKKH